MQVRKQQLELDMEQQTGSKLGKEYVKAVYYHRAYLTYMQSTIMQNARLDEAQAGIKTAGININNLRYTDDTTLVAESEELNSLLPFPAVTTSSREHASRKGSSSSLSRRGEEETQEEAPGTEPYFLDVKCPGCYKITTVFSHAQTVVLCVGCSTVLCQPTGGKARLTEGCSFRQKLR